MTRLHPAWLVAGAAAAAAAAAAGAGGGVDGCPQAEVDEHTEEEQEAAAAASQLLQARAGLVAGTRARVRPSGAAAPGGAEASEAEAARGAEASKVVAASVAEASGRFGGPMADAFPPLPQEWANEFSADACNRTLVDSQACVPHNGSSFYVMCCPSEGLPMQLALLVKCCDQCTSDGGMPDCGAGASSKAGSQWCGQWANPDLVGWKFQSFGGRFGMTWGCKAGA